MCVRACPCVDGYLSVLRSLPLARVTKFRVCDSALSPDFVRESFLLTRFPCLFVFDLLLQRMWRRRGRPRRRRSGKTPPTRSVGRSSTRIHGTARTRSSWLACLVCLPSLLFDALLFPLPSAPRVRLLSISHLRTSAFSGNVLVFNNSRLLPH